MKHSIVIQVFLSVLLIGPSAQAQVLKNLGKKAEKAAERTIERRVEKETAKKTDQVLDEVFESKSKEQKKSHTEKTENAPGNTERTDGSTIEIITGSSFFPNSNIIYAENFARDAKGDFPSGWETSSGGEVITVGSTKALKLYPNGRYVPQINALPENYALEFDLTTKNLDYKSLSGSGFYIVLSNEKKLSKPATGGQFGFSLWYGAVDQSNKVHVSNWGKGVTTLENTIPFKMKEKLNTTTHFTIVVNGNRLRIFVDNQKAVDLPSFLQQNMGRYFQFYLKGTQAKENHIVAISDIRITEESADLRSQLLKGKFTTNNILFASGSDKIQSASFKLLDDIAGVIKSDDAHYAIIGHTDSDGDKTANLDLSKKRAESVKNYLVSRGVSASRVQADGKGESQPVASNSTSEGKAQNRRVEFVRQ
ncbi:MAG: OmpA family protein [Niabella sp.]